jgi:dTDP-4-amino-4,6-dideoxygalactose transaminase
MQTSYRNIGYDDYLPETEKASLEVLSLPVHPSLERHELATIALAVSEAINQTSLVAH